MAVIEPHKRKQGHITVALLTDRGKVESEHGETFVSPERFRARHPDGRLFTSVETVEDLVRGGAGEMLRYDAMPKRWRAEPLDEDQWNPRATDAIVIGSPVFPTSRTAAMQGLVGWRDWLESYGSHPDGGTGSVSMNLLKATIPGRVWTMGGDPPPITWTLGGRQEFPEWVDPYSSHRNVVHFDLAAAYPTAMAELRIGGATWRRAGARFYTRHGRSLDEMDAMWPLALGGKVELPPGLVWGPLVKRRLGLPQERASSPQRAKILGPGPYVPTFPTAGRFRGVWMWRELRGAIALGAEIEVEEVWLLDNDGTHPFMPWWRACQEGRAHLDGFAEHLCKLTAAACWGRFVPSVGKRYAVTATRFRVLPPARNTNPPSWDVGEMVTSTVRARAADFLTRMGRRVISFHTDGGWVTAEGDEPPPGWQTKAAAWQLDIIDESRWRYRKLPGQPWDVRMAGVPRRLAAGRFSHDWKTTLPGLKDGPSEGRKLARGAFPPPWKDLVRSGKVKVDRKGGA